jgi:hypothetical protein
MPGDNDYGRGVEVRRHLRRRRLSEWWWIKFCGAVGVLLAVLLYWITVPEARAVPHEPARWVTPPANETRSPK